MNIQTLYAITILSFSLALSGRSITKLVSIDYKEEMVGGVHFVYRCDVIDGEIKEVWAVDDKPVEQSVYDEKILQCELEERRIERQKEYEASRDRRAFKQAASEALYKKLLKQASHSIEKLLHIIDEHNLATSIVYKPEGIASKKAMKKLRTEYLPEILRICNTKDVGVRALKELYEEVQEYPERMRVCLYASIENAINTVDDTRQLKELLHLVTQEL